MKTDQHVSGFKSFWFTCPDGPETRDKDQDQRPGPRPSDWNRWLNFPSCTSPIWWLLTYTGVYLLFQVAPPVHRSLFIIALHHRTSSSARSRCSSCYAHCASPSVVWLAEIKSIRILQSIRRHLFFTCFFAAAVHTCDLSSRKTRAAVKCKEQKTSRDPKETLNPKETRPFKRPRPPKENLSL